MTREVGVLGHPLPKVLAERHPLAAQCQRLQPIHPQLVGDRHAGISGQVRTYGRRFRAIERELELPVLDVPAPARVRGVSPTPRRAFVRRPAGKPTLPPGNRHPTHRARPAPRLGPRNPPQRWQSACSRRHCHGSRASWTTGRVQASRCDRHAATSHPTRKERPGRSAFLQAGQARSRCSESKRSPIGSSIRFSTSVAGTGERCQEVQAPLVGVVMGSDSDWDMMQHAVVAARRSAFPSRPACCRRTACPTTCSSMPKSRRRGSACASSPARAAPRTCRACSPRKRVPVLGVPVPSKYLRGEDSLLSIVQMPKGIPVATFAIGEAGAANAAALRGGDARAARTLPSREARRVPVSRRTRPRDARACRRRRKIVLLFRREMAWPSGAAGSWAACSAWRRKPGLQGSRCSIRQPTGPPASVADRHIHGDYLDPTPVSRDSLRSSVRPRRPSSRTCRPTRSTSCRAPRGSLRRRPAWQSRRTVSARRRFCSNGFAVAHRMRCCIAPTDAAAAEAELCPGIVKSARLGYDGKGQIRQSVSRRGRRAFGRWAASPACSRSSSTSPARCRSSSPRPDGGRRRRGRWPRTATGTASSMSRSSRRESRRSSPTAPRNRHRVATALDYRGVLCVEMFVGRDGRLLVNEIAPRPHNSGHYTIDACVTSQFEQQARILAGLPLGDPRLHDSRPSW